MTAVEWLQYEINYCKEKNGIIELTQCLFDSLIEQAKEMEKQQIIDAYNQYVVIKNKAEQYYNETYGSKGSDEITNCDIQTEISDEEIEIAWDSYQIECLEKFMKDSMIAGYAITNKENFAKWYREQLKSKQ